MIPSPTSGEDSGFCVLAYNWVGHCYAIIRMPQPWALSSCPSVLSSKPCETPGALALGPV